MFVAGTTQTRAGQEHGGKRIGYRSAYAEDFDRSRRWTQGKDYFDVLDPKYQADPKKSLRHLLVDAERYSQDAILRQVSFRLCTQFLEACLRFLEFAFLHVRFGLLA